MKKYRKWLGAGLIVAGVGLAATLWPEDKQAKETLRVIAQGEVTTGLTPVPEPVVVTTPQTVKAIVELSPEQKARVEEQLAKGSALVLGVKTAKHKPDTELHPIDSVIQGMNPPKGTSTTTALTQPKLEATPNPLAEARATTPPKALEVPSAPRAATVRKHIAEKTAPVRNRVNNGYRAFKEQVLSKNNLFGQ
ncbi:MAG: hypothetical protein WAZ18_04455 [Alphaproteobacteria bacterium]